MEAHPYSPKDLTLHGFVPNFMSQTTILAIFAAASIVVFSLAWILPGKEYSKGDSRYAGRDSAVIAVEGITAVLEGPASLLAAYALATHEPYSDVLQVAISFGQLYGCLVYFITAILEGDNFAASSYHYYAYYVGANASWVVIPALITIRSWKRICQSFKAQYKRKSKTQ
ncbi:hypothetical protein Cgig2_029686 [Carnegiea gigantea]|uniref:EXPERA domain-containing protein n=1 Tax=Carnegiea gigantea TaxID=171969 RepID=A0A9Q1KJ62_9CARY|nr:hypothetical protein Cgig2_029686 [Carnegiea gigantea]